LVEGEGVYVKDLEQKKYLDFWAGISTVSIGHRNREVEEAVKRQMEKIVHCASQSYYTLPALELARIFVKIAPIDSCKVTFLTSGTEANEIAIKMVKRFTKKHELIALQGSYHAWGYHAAIPGTPVSHYPHSASTIGPSAPGIYYAPAPYCYRCSLGLQYPNCGVQCAKMIEDIINFSTSRDVAGLISEVIQGVGGIVTPPDEYFLVVKKILDKYDIPLILDEVQTRLGQTGKLWGSETYNVTPDVITTAKSIANGWPISATLAKDAISDTLEEGDHYSTFGNNPVMCMASCATIDYIMKHKLWENAEKMGEQLMKRLEEMKSKYGLIGDVRGKGLMIGIEIVKDKQSKIPGIEEGKEIRKLCAKHGLIIGYGGWWNNVIRIQPPIIINQDHINEALKIFEKSIKEVEKNL
jgi:4-aminobutyrate aminotransferase-like enzyme